MKDDNRINLFGKDDENEKNEKEEKKPENVSRSKKVKASKKKGISFKKWVGRFVAAAKKRIRGKKISTRSCIIAIVVIFLLVFIIADTNAGGIMSEANGKFVSLFAKNSTDEFSFETNASGAYSFVPYSDGFAMLNESGLVYVNSSGNIASSQQLVYGSPSMSVAGSKILVFDRGNTNYSLFSSGSLYSEQVSDDSITDAAVAKNGNYVFAAKNSGYKSVLYGFDKNGKVIFRWNCPEGYISDVAISDSGGKTAVVVTNALNAVLNSKLVIFDFEYDSAYAEFDFSGELLAGIKFISNEKILVISENKVYLIKGREIETIYEYGSSQLAFADINFDSFTAVITDDYSKDDSFVLTAFGKSGRLLFSVPVSGKVRGVATSDKSISVLFSDKTETYSRRGKLVGSVGDIKHFNDIVLNGNYIYLLASDSVKKYPAYGNIATKTVETVTE